MPLPIFYLKEFTGKRIILDEETSKHISAVLRLQNGDEILFTDGKGKKALATIADNNRKKTIIEIAQISETERSPHHISIAISLIKNTSRFEWFLEKCTEIGISEVIPILCERTEKEKFRRERLENILVSAMLQSQQVWLPVLQEPVAYHEIIKSSHHQKFIAHCLPENKIDLKNALSSSAQESIILIGPEGDFTDVEIGAALDNKFIPVSLGNTRLRTETAGIVAATLLKFLSPH